MTVKIIETNLQFRGTLQKRFKTDYIVLHHAEATKASVEDIHRWHLERGWAGIGYHFYVKKDGTIYKGRPLDTIGAHVMGYNNVSVGVCAEGAYMTETMPDVQKQAIIGLLKELVKIYPNVKIVGHRDLNRTDCPGKNYPFNEIVQAVYKKEDDKVMGTLFKDVPDNHWAIKDIQWAKDMGLIRGYDDGTYGLGKPITREELAVILHRFYEKFIGGNK
ncbi:N-acetylmuramoyl-L-alanine amidase [Caldanaerobacter subterraneus]|nr:N-acetylmuramoyl-L-alanine amidase [Caldanaerobacter subterraneus]